MEIDLLHGFVQKQSTANFVEEKFREHGYGLQKIMFRVFP